ncbi:MAG: hypothetical protein IKN07_04440, partial [Lachnospiraceae bacterium]|nr:hypothetical protein [Lachnospiraceae bacterium]
MSKQQRRNIIIVSILFLAAIIAGIVMMPQPEKHETIKAAMRDAVLHDENKIDFFGFAVDPSLVSGYIVTGVLLFIA